MKNRYIASFEAAQIASKEVPAFRAGDTLRLGVEIKEGEKKRVQTFEGVVIGRSGNGVDATFTIRKLGANNIGVERIFPLYCESLQSIEVLRRGDVRRAKLNYLRALKGKAAKIRELKR
ncbi:MULTISPECIES: 50S ribosomal protein L19 [Aliarcobacter]|jgi:large subunit ribosomal protein L19|uniref:Large ribosomal subunit protein bL19 n=6 Tax=Arcobacteraceae TaxID=2808963 RepID=A0AA96DV57_9BACT|nr:50S ribosomal protein L19 [Aliarcobacter cryaerophilus]NCB12431.1 50S ribosomal protein L19 [Erysipelotrichia bacterium]OQA74859.1 MAG: 50S ribosomal protein L19 [Candidatus Dependentiae bacterium ADurb.Bin246]PRM91800.1 50S ribosomal protein L19 [Arcobacter cryaerophilus gv. occultus]WNL17177.1 50S ribosomal protein L19 [Arcobacter sp. AZ-2023]WPD04287.1 50S ribosomal protein L19 [Arcobacter sp. DSM 115972]WPD06281.1 50S ribosomal protein L19 [Arcobacter sp. DSM 115956]WPD08372.1 50S rib